MCNTPGEATGRVFLDLNEIDIEHYLINNPAIFADIVNRNQNILAQQPDNRDGQQYVIPRLNLGMLVNSDGILFTRNDADGDSSDDSDDSGEEIMRFRDVGIGMRFDANTISIGRLPEFENMNEDDAEATEDEEEDDIDVDEEEEEDIDVKDI